jgi:hypothetical protein
MRLRLLGLALALLAFGAALRCSSADTSSPVANNGGASQGAVQRVSVFVTRLTLEPVNRRKVQ